VNVSSTNLEGGELNIEIDLIKKFQSRARKDLSSSHNATNPKDSPDNQEIIGSTQRLVGPLSLNQIESGDKTVELIQGPNEHKLDTSPKNLNYRSNLRIKKQNITLNHVNGIYELINQISTRPNRSKQTYMTKKT
jgi:hypothetical protein